MENAERIGHEWYLKAEPWWWECKRCGLIKSSDVQPTFTIGPSGLTCEETVVKKIHLD